MRVVKPSEEERDVPRGVVGGAEISQATTGATNIYMGVFRVPAGARSRPHYHEACESAVYMLSGRLSVKWGDHLEDEVEIGPGDMVYVPPRETHILQNLSDSDAAETPCTGPSWRSRAMRLRSASIAAFVRRSRRVRSSSRSWRNLKSERIVWSATCAAVTSRTSNSRRGGVPRISEMRAST